MSSGGNVEQKKIAEDLLASDEWHEVLIPA